MRVRLDDRAEKVTESIIGSAFEVSNHLGHGFLEIVYRKALVHELRQRGLSTSEEVPFPVSYKDLEVGTYFADVVVEEMVIVQSRRELGSRTRESGFELPESQWPADRIAVQFREAEARIPPSPPLGYPCPSVRHPCSSV